MVVEKTQMCLSSCLQRGLVRFRLISSILCWRRRKRSSDGLSKGLSSKFTRKHADRENKKPWNIDMDQINDPAKYSQRKTENVLSDRKKRYTQGSNKRILPNITNQRHSTWEVKARKFIHMDQINGFRPTLQMKDTERNKRRKDIAMAQIKELGLTLQMKGTQRDKWRKEKIDTLIK